MSVSNKMMAAASGAGGAVPLSEIFSIDLWSGNGSTQYVTNGLDFANAKGSVIIKSRTAIQPAVFVGSGAIGDSYAIQLTEAGGWFQGGGFNQASNGYILNSSDGITNAAGETYVGWSFIRSQGFFNSFYRTGNGTAGYALEHGLGANLGMAAIKKLTGDSWHVYFKDLGQNAHLRFNTNGSYSSQSNIFTADADDTYIYLGSDAAVNGTGSGYLCYFWADNPNGYIRSGSYTSGQSVTLGFQPQFIIYKAWDGTGDWFVRDNVRGWNSSGDSPQLLLNSTSDEGQSGGVYPNSTGFTTDSDGLRYVYLAVGE